MDSQLARIVDDLNAVTTRLHALARRLTPDEAMRRVDAARWSVAENVAHLSLTSEAFLPLMRTALDEARGLGAGAGRQYRRDATGWLLSMLVGPQPRIGRLRLGGTATPAAFVPGGARSFADILADFDRLQHKLVAAVQSADGLPIDRVRLESPFRRGVFYNLYSAFVIIPRHQLRHILQAEWLWP